jgi:hypothetical protein
MSQSHIRLLRTPDIDKVLTFLKQKYRLLSEAEILKLLLSEKYEEELQGSLKPKHQPQQQFAAQVIDLETQPDLTEAKAQARIPRQHTALLTLAGTVTAPADLSQHKKKYIE